MVDAQVETELGHGRGTVAPTDHGEAVGVGHRLGHVDRALLEAGVLEHAHRAVPEDGARMLQWSDERQRGGRADVEALPAVGDVAHEDLDLLVGPHGDHVGGNEELVLARALEEALAGVDPVGLHQRVPHLVPLGQHEREAHGPADGQVVDLVDQGFDDAHLGADLRPAQNGDEGVHGPVQEAAEDLDLLGQEPARGAGQLLRRTDHRGVGPVTSAEGVVDVEVEAPDQLGDEVRVVGLLTGVEAEVLHELHAGGELLEPLTDGSHGVLLIGLALGPAEVAADGDVGAPRLQPLDRRHRRGDAEVVVDVPVGDRDVEVGPDQDLLAPWVG
jgi:hypothetical protein